MAIKGMTGQGPTLPKIGELRKGAPKPERGPGQDLTYFRFTTDDADAADRFREIYGLEPRAIRVFLPFGSTGENFEAWKEEWTASSLKHRCDGEDCVLWLDSKGNYSKEPKSCPGGCKQVGRLKVIIPELKRWAFVTVLTTSEHDIRQLDANLLALESLQRARGGDLCGVPLILKRAPRKISTPRGNGERKRAEKWLLTIEAQPQWVELQIAAQEQAALPHVETLALPEWNGEEEIEEIEGEVAQDDGRAEIHAEMHDIYISKGKSEDQWREYSEKELDPRTTDELGQLLLKWRAAQEAKAKSAAKGETVAV